MGKRKTKLRTPKNKKLRKTRMTLEVKTMKMKWPRRLQIWKWKLSKICILQETLSFLIRDWPLIQILTKETCQNVFKCRQKKVMKPKLSKCTTHQTVGPTCHRQTQAEPASSSRWLESPSKRPRSTQNLVVKFWFQELWNFTLRIWVIKLNFWVMVILQYILRSTTKIILN